MYVCMCSELNVLISTVQPNKLEITYHFQTCTHMHMHTHMYIHTHTRTHMHTHMHMHTHTHTHMHTQQEKNFCGSRNRPACMHYCVCVSQCSLFWCVCTGRCVSQRVSVLSTCVLVFTPGGFSPESWASSSTSLTCGLMMS